MIGRHFLNAFLEPESVALIGISRRTGRGAFNILESLKAYGYQGKIYPVNPKAGEILGTPCIKDVALLPDAVDLAIIATSRGLVPGLVRACAKKAVKGIIIVTEGFNEADEPGRDLQREIDQTVRHSTVRILGPNSIGVFNAFSNFSSSFLPLPKTRSPVALASQSGGFFEGFADCPFGKGVDVGNTSDVDLTDALDYLGSDTDTRVIVLYAEQISRGRQFIDIARQTATTKPILIIRGGRSVSGKKASASHTGSMGGDDAIYAAAFLKAGIQQVETVQDIGDFTRAFLSLPPFTGNRVGIITPTGGGGILTLDQTERFGFLPATLSSETKNAMDNLFQPWITPKNPVDILSSAMVHGFKAVYQRMLEAFFRDDGVDAILTICGPYTLKTIRGMMERHPNKPVVSWVLGADQSDIAKKAREVGFAPYYPSPDRALRALRGLRQHALTRERFTRGKG